LTLLLVVGAVDRTRFTRLTYLLFGLALLASNGLSLRSSVDILPFVAVVLSLLVVVAAVAGLVRPDAAPFGVRVDIGAQPTWVLALLWFGSALLLAGVALQL
jgi:FtsH-binding integral membrane protein